jgi:hypothetical protein
MHFKPTRWVCPISKFYPATSIRHQEEYDVAFNRLSLMIGIAAGALMMVAADRGFGQSSDPNAAPNPYRMLDSWA